jgi:hypothetical protein
MSIKVSVKVGGLMIGSCILLAACSSHINPLKTVRAKAAGQFLVVASQIAEKKLSLFNGSGGQYYGACMQGKARKPLCKNLYQAMLDYAKTTRTFKDITLQDLTEKSVFKSLEVNYQAEVFNAV